MLAPDQIEEGSLVKDDNNKIPEEGVGIPVGKEKHPYSDRNFSPRKFAIYKGVHQISI